GNPRRTPVSFLPISRWEPRSPPRRNRKRSWPRPSSFSASDPFHLVAQLLQLGNNAFTLIALNLDPPILDRSPCPAPLLERGGEFPKASLVQRQVEYGRHAFASTPRRFPADFRRQWFLGRFVV